MESWDDLRHFLAIVHHGSLNAAAKSLGVDQSTVFRRLRSLENYLGTQVFDRRHHGRYELTAAGESLLEQASHIELATFNIERDVRGRDLELSGTIRVTTADDIALAILPRHLSEFQRLYPSISIDLLTANRYYSLGRGEADVAIRPGYSSDESRVIPRKICSSSLALFASPGYLEQAGTPRRSSDLEAHRLIGWCGDLSPDGFSNFIDRVRAADSVYNSNNLVVHRAMAEAGLGIAYLPEFFGAASDKLQPVLPEFREDSEYIWILQHDDLRHAARVRAFVDFIIEAFRQDPALNPELRRDKTA